MGTCNSVIRDRARTVGAVAAITLSLLLSAAASASEQRATESAEAPAVFAEHQSGHWNAAASFHEGEGRRYECEMSTRHARYLQVRAAETSFMQSRWNFPLRLEVPAENVEIHDVVVGSRVVEVTHLPWRLANAPKRGDIDVSVELPLLAFRSSSNQAWLPFEYLTDDILESGKLSLKYSYEGPDEVGREGEVLVDMEGFGDVLSWCSKQLLADRLDEPRARAMLSN